VLVRIVKLHRGGIQVDSTPGQGTVFRIFFPSLEKVDAEESESICSSPASSIVGGSESLLLVDDEELFVDMTRRSLKILGYRVTSAEGSIQALELIRKNSDTFDLVISDQTMPEMTGLELARKIHQWRPELPVLLCTGFSDAITAESQREAGVERVLMKPVTRQEMAAAIRKVLDSRKAVRG
jgi:CheY-like chemotaxis protein